ncbi:hypothetical protein JN11_03945 [Mucilaginibacter frigoritolerans]|uniref:KTSC domain-containing protein n=1 Tax=Mucilaginibacter frigoritolerans TaxID=652788 RepID=A0A562TTD9_9SPHI|nr:hypothetical protein JN11_03945 [Mucilaginibacter frigoritolerans]
MLKELPKIDISMHIANNQAIKFTLRQYELSTVEEVWRVSSDRKFAVLLLVNKTNYYVYDDIDFINVGTTKLKAENLFFNYCMRWYGNN